MPGAWLDGCYRDPGRNAGYNEGRSQMLRAVAHYTVGRDSRAVGRDGYFHWLVHRDASREGGCTQYAEVDAITWHAANPGNPYGPGIEFERMTTGGVNAEGLSNAEPLTENQVEWGRRIIEFCDAWGIPADLWNGPRYGDAVMPGGGWRGWVNHQAIDADRSDGLLRAEWNAMTTKAPDEVEVEDMQSQVYGPGSPMVYITDGIFRRRLSGEDERAALGNMGLLKGDPLPVNQWFLDSLVDVTIEDVKAVGPAVVDDDTRRA